MVVIAKHGVAGPVMSVLALTSTHTGTHTTAYTTTLSTVVGAKRVGSGSEIGVTAVL